MALASHIGEYFGNTLVLSNGGTKTVKKWEFPAGIAFMGVPCSGWFSPSRVELRELAA